MGKLRELLVEKNNLVDELFSLTKSVEINTEEDIDSYIEMVGARTPIIEKMASIDKKVSSILDKLEEMTDEISGLVASMNMTISKTSGEIIEAENLLMKKIEDMSKGLKQEAKTIVEGKNAKALYQKDFEQKPKIDIKN